MLTYKDGRLYEMATAFHLSWPYGVPRIMSSFNFTNRDMGPPRDAVGNIVAPQFNPSTNQCTNGWVCEHRWHGIKEMVKFRNAVEGTAVWVVKFILKLKHKAYFDPFTALVGQW